MLLEFKLRNFRSFLRVQVFSFPAMPGRVKPGADEARGTGRRKPQGSRVAVIFGPNGTGKTNLILALETLRNLVLQSATYTDTQYAEQHKPFQFGGNEGGATEFELELQLEGSRYRYTLAYDGERIQFERLLVYRTGKPQRWFEREFDPAEGTDRWAPFSPNFNGSRELWRRMTRPKALFLTTAARLECEQLQPLFRWFEHGLNIRFGTDGADLSSIAASLRDEGLKTRMLEVLHAVDIPVEDIRVAESGPSAQANERMRVEVGYERTRATQVWLDSEVEAHGTLRLLNLLGPLLSAFDRGSLLVVDEFDAGLHPLVARFVVQLAKQTPVSHGGPQLLLTSHEAALMVPEILDHDEIWLMERDRDRSSQLLPVSDRGPRKRERLVRGYLRGRYGAIPNIRLERVL